MKLVVANDSPEAKSIAVSNIGGKYPDCRPVTPTGQDGQGEVPGDGKFRVPGSECRVMGSAEFRVPGDGRCWVLSTGFRF